MSADNLPSGYNPDGLAPKIVIKDLAGTTKYTWEAAQVAALPVQDFNLDSWFVHRGKNTDHGRASFVIDDRNNLLIDTSLSNKESKIKNQWTVEVSLGKNAAGLTLAFKGRIFEVEVDRSETNMQKINIFAVGIGVRSAERITRIKRFQKKAANGVDYDDTDTDSKVSEYFKDVLVDTDHHPHQGLPSEGFTTTGVQDIDIKVADFQKNFISWGAALQELANISGGVYGFKPNLDAYLRARGSVSSGYLFTNDLGSLLTSGWDKAKFGIVRNNPMIYKDSSIDFGFSIYHGIGANHDTKDYEQTSANALLDLTTLHFAFPFSPKKSNISKLAPFLSKVGTITKELHVCIVGKLAAGGPDEDDLRQRVVIQGSRLQNELSAAKYFEASPFNVAVSKDEQLWMLFSKMQKVTTEHVDIDYQTGVGTYYDSTDGLTWTARTGDAKFRTYHSIPVHIILENTNARNKFGVRETVVPLSDFPDEESAVAVLSGLAETKARLKRIYSRILISVPDTMPEPGETVRFVDVFNGLDTNVEIVGWDVGGSNTGTDDNRGASAAAFEIEEHHF